MAMAAGSATLKYIKEHDVLSHVEKVGAKLMQELQDIQEHVPEIGDVRGRGLMIGAEIVAPHKKQNANGSYPADAELASVIQRKCFEKGLIVETGGRHGSVIRFLPPLIVTEAQIDDIITIFREAVYEAVK